VNEDTCKKSKKYTKINGVHYYGDYHDTTVCFSLTRLYLEKNHFIFSSQITKKFYLQKQLVTHFYVVSFLTQFNYGDSLQYLFYI